MVKTIVSGIIAGLFLMYFQEFKNLTRQRKIEIIKRWYPLVLKTFLSPVLAFFSAAITSGLYLGITHNDTQAIIWIDFASGIFFLVL